MTALMLEVGDAVLDGLAERVARLVAAELRKDSPGLDDEGYLAPDAAAMRVS
jgi:hypothetical protein